jgi:hypothetical protein
MTSESFPAPESSPKYEKILTREEVVQRDAILAEGAEDPEALAAVLSKVVYKGGWISYLRSLEEKGE